MKIRTLTRVLLLVVATAAVGCEDTRPPYFNEQPDYSDPVFQDKPGYYTRQPVYDWNAPAKPAAADPKDGK